MSEARPSGARPWEQRREVRVEGAGTLPTPVPAAGGDGTVVGAARVGSTAVSRRHHPLLRLKRRLARI